MVAGVMSLNGVKNGWPKEEKTLVALQYLQAKATLFSSPGMYACMCVFG